MSTWIARYATIAAVFLLANMNSSRAGPISDDIGTVSALLASGYKFVGGSDISAEQKQRVPTTTAPPMKFGDAKYKTGSAYLEKDSDLVICSFTIVMSNPLVGPAPTGDQAVIGSKCYRIK